MNLARLVLSGAHRAFSSGLPAPLRNRKSKSTRKLFKSFSDARMVAVCAGNGGDGNISFLRAFGQEFAGPDGGDGGSGGHVLFEASREFKDLSHFKTLINAESGEVGFNKDCHGKNGKHTIVKVPVGTIVKSKNNEILFDMHKEGCIFIAARGGAGGKGNRYFASATNQTPQVAEIGALGEQEGYHLELRSMAHMGLIGFPNAGKSTLLSAVTRASPKVAPYAFTTLHPNIGTIHYEDYEQIAIADLPGLVPDSHLNKGLGIQFLKHVERCCGIIFLIDVSDNEPWHDYKTLLNELQHYNEELLSRPKLVVANKMDLPGAKENLVLLQKHINEEIIPISAKTGINLTQLLENIRKLYDNSLKELKP